MKTNSTLISSRRALEIWKKWCARGERAYLLLHFLGIRIDAPKRRENVKAWRQGWRNGERMVREMGKDIAREIKPAVTLNARTSVEVSELGFVPGMSAADACAEIVGSITTSPTCVEAEHAA